MTHVDFLKTLGACEEACEFAGTKASLRDAWEECHHPDWMQWLLRKVGHDDPKVYRLYACQCVRNTPVAYGLNVWDLLRYPGAKEVVHAAERFAFGHASRYEFGGAHASALYVLRLAASNRPGVWVRCAIRAAASTIISDARTAMRRSALWSAVNSKQDAWDAQASMLREMIPYDVVEEHIENMKG